MTLRITSGIHRSIRLDCPATGVRPTTDRVKEAMFSTLSMDFDTVEVLDLFAGSGNLGIEAISRGASKVTFVDNSRLSLKTIEKNLKRIDALPSAVIIRSDALSFIRKCPDTFDLIFMDPPYNKGLASELAPHVYCLLAPGGVLAIEHSPRETIDLTVWKSRIYGDTMISYIAKE